MSLWEQVFSFNGRMRRSDWWIKGLLAGLAFGLVWLPFKLIVGQAFPSLGGYGLSIVAVLGFLLMAPFLWVQTALCVKRGHDLNIPAWPIITYQVVGVGMSYAPYDLLLPPDSVLFTEPAILTMGAVNIAISLIFLVLLGFIPGTRGPNRFGPSTTATDKPAFITPGGVD